jgi:hypothetical protein
MTVDMGATISVRSLSPFGERVGVRGSLEPWRDFDPSPHPSPYGGEGDVYVVKDFLVISVN